MMTGSWQSGLKKQKKRGGSHHEMVMLRRAAGAAISAANPRYVPFIDAMANPIKILALVDMAMRRLEQEPLPEASVETGKSAKEFIISQASPSVGPKKLSN